jgi:hypothetical protein
VSAVHNGGTMVLLTQTGAASNRDGAWAQAKLNLSAYVGQSIRILVEAADASTASLVEAGVDTSPSPSPSAERAGLDAGAE